jgi:hypothetical protein
MTKNSLTKKVDFDPFLLKAQTLDKLQDYFTVNPEEVWDQVQKAINPYFDKEKKRFKDGDIEQLQIEMMQKSVDCFDELIVSDRQRPIAFQFINDCIQWYQAILSGTIPEKIAARTPAEFKKLAKENDVETFQYQLQIPITIFDTIYEEYIIAARIAVNNKMYEYFDDRELMKFKTLFGLAPEFSTANHNPDIHYFLLGFLLQERSFLIRTPIERLIADLKSKKRVNKYKQRYVDNFESSFQSIFIVEFIDKESHIVWLRDLFNHHKLYPLVDISMSENLEAAMLKILHVKLIPIFETERGVNVYIHNGSSTMYHYFPEREDLEKLTIGEGDFDFKIVTEYIRPGFLAHYNHLKDKYWEEVKQRCLDAGFKGGLDELEQYYLTVKSRVEGE